MIPSVGATVDLTIPKPDDSKGPTASVSTGTKAVGASANIQDGKVTSVTGSAGFVVGPKAAEKIPGGENVSASFGKVIDTIKNIYHSAAQSPQPGEFENLSD